MPRQAECNAQQVYRCRIREEVGLADVDGRGSDAYVQPSPCSAYPGGGGEHAQQPHRQQRQQQACGDTASSSSGLLPRPPPSPSPTAAARIECVHDRVRKLLVDGRVEDLLVTTVLLHWSRLRRPPSTYVPKLLATSSAAPAVVTLR